MSLDLSNMSLDLSNMSLDLSSMSLDLSSMSFYLSSMSFYLSSMSLDLSSMSLDLSSMSLDLSSMSFVDDPLSQSSLWGGMKHFLSALKNLLESRPETQRGGIKTRENRQESYKKSPWNVPSGWKRERQGLDKKWVQKGQESYKKSRWKRKGGNKKTVSIQRRGCQVKGEGVQVKGEGFQVKGEGFKGDRVHDQMRWGSIQMRGFS
ncbi:hypothetical protein TNCV_830431 [Trichonephila clavipes]|nr:hypothetical protein TNCV_830431 [Trichonephila clavipes]